jgi:hypothetical protein
MSKFLLNLFVKFLNVLPKSKIIRNLKSNYHLNSLQGLAQSAQLTPSRSDPLRRPQRPSPTCLDRMPMPSPQKYLSPFALCLPSTSPLLSPVTNMWAPHVSPFFSPPTPPQIPADPSQVRRPASSLRMPLVTPQNSEFWNVPKIH